MAFTERKFSRLSRLNKFKKTVVAIRQFLEDSKDLAYVTELLSWLETYEGYTIEIPGNRYEWGVAVHTLLQEIGQESLYAEEKPFDDPGVERRIFPITVVLHNIRSPFNVGSIIRSSEAFGAERVILTGITPGPSQNTKVQRTAKNALLPIVEQAEAGETFERLQDEGYAIVALEKTKTSLPLGQAGPGKCALILGNEEFGIPDTILKRCDRVYHIPLFGVKNSINVSVAAGIALYGVTRGFSGTPEDQ